MKDNADVLRRVLRNTFWDAYDHLGVLLLTNGLWSFFAIGSFALSVSTDGVLRAASGLFCLIAVPWATAGMLRVTYGMAVSRDARIRDFFTGAVALWKPSMVLAVGALIVVALAAGNILFYLSLARTSPFLGMTLAGICLWLTAAFAAGMQFVAPAAVELWTADDPDHRERAEWLSRLPVTHYRRLRIPRLSRGVVGAVKVGLVLLLQAPLLAAFHLIHVLCFWFLCLISGAGLVLLATGITCLACHHLYGETVAHLTGIGDRRQHEERSLRELLPPWDTGKPGGGR